MDQKAAAIDGTDRQTNGQTDTRALQRLFTDYYAGSVSIVSTDDGLFF